MRTIRLMSALAVLLVPAVANAEVPEFLEEYGVAVTAGGGVVQFTDGSMRDFATEGGGWEGRLGFGTKTPITIEAAYLGSLHSIDALGLDYKANLLGTGIEGNVRVNLLPGSITPYLLVGAGWTRYSLVNTDTNTSDVRDSDDIVQFPLGLGVGFRQGPMLLDVRAVFRPTSQADMFVGATDGSLNSWSGTIRAGFEY